MILVDTSVWVDHRRAGDPVLGERLRDVAQRRYAQIIASGETIPWSEMRDYLTERAEGKTPPRPQPRTLGR